MSSVLFLQQWLAWRSNGEFVELGDYARTIGIGFGGRQALAQLGNFFFARATPANLWTATGCGHGVSPEKNLVAAGPVSRGAQRVSEPAAEILSIAKDPVRSVVAAGPVSRILSAGLLQQDGHSSGPRIAARL
jgi:hypothetical protein